MGRTTDPVYPNKSVASGIAIFDAATRADLQRTIYVPRTLIRPQNGLSVRWHEGRVVPPDMTLGRKAALVAKRSLDILGAAGGLILLAPLLLLIALWIKCTDRGPVLFRQLRLG